MGLSSFSRPQTEKFSGAVSRPDSPSPVSMAAEADQDQEEEHENMKNLLISHSSTLNCDQRGLRRSRAVRSKTSSFLHLHTTPTITDCQRHVHLQHQFNFKAVRLVLLLLEMSVQPVKSDIEIRSAARRSPHFDFIGVRTQKNVTASWFELRHAKSAFSFFIGKHEKLNIFTSAGAAEKKVKSFSFA